jgi:spore coat protein U-like protein
METNRLAAAAQAALVVAAALASAAAPAATTTATLSVQATLVDTCLISATPLTFPTYLAGGGAVTGTATISVICTKNAQYGVGLNTGSTAGTTYTQRLLANAGNTLQYNLYTSNTYSTVWGDGSGATQIVSGNAAGFGTPISLTVYGEVPDSAANRAAPPGAYSDTILVVLTY